jgi:hypothetical protein
MTAAATPVVVLGCLLAVAAPQTPQINQAQPASRFASLFGEVRSVVTREPVPDMEVRIRLSGDPDWKTVTTDATGRYSFTNLLPGRYFIALHGPGYRSELEDVFLRSGMQLKATLLKRAVLEGRVTDDAGQPVAGIEVCALRRSRVADRAELVPTEYAITGSDGVYRLSRSPARAGFTLGPGEFVLAVIPTGCFLAETGRPHGALPLAGIVPTFFPGTTSFRDATVVTVAGDEQQSGFDIKLRRGPSTRLEGRIAPLPQTLLPPVARVILEPPEHEVPITRVLNVGPDGRFAFDGVLAGEYRLIVPPTYRLNDRSVWATQTVTVSGAPTQTVNITTKPTGIVSGQINFDGAPLLLPGVRVFLTVNLAVVRGNTRIDPALLPTYFGIVGSDGRFSIPGVMPGAYVFTVSGADAQGWVLDAATIPAAPGAASEHRDVFNLPFTSPEEVDIVGATLSMTRAASTLQVMLRDRDDQPVPNMNVVLFAADPRYWYASSRRVIRQRVSQAGTVTFTNLPQGDYVAAAVGFLPDDWNTTPRLEALARAGTRIRLEKSDNRAVAIRVDPGIVK